MLSPNAQLPSYGSEGAIGLDLYSLLRDEDAEAFRVKFEPLQRRLIRTGIAVEIPHGYYGRIAPRSGIALKRGLDVMAGVIDADYRGEIFVLLVNLTNRDVFVGDGERIAQLILERADKFEPKWDEHLNNTVRGADGFGSTGS
jgi:dUTP pyrophosphatase